jgi:hypothetical protein
MDLLVLEDLMESNKIPQKPLASGKEYLVNKLYVHIVVR